MLAMFEFTTFNLTMYALALVVLFFVELLMFWAGCAIGDQDPPPSWFKSFVVVLPVFAVTIVLFEVLCRYFGVGPDNSNSPLQAYGIGTIPFAAIVGSLASWVLALILYIPAVTYGSIYKGFWVASSEVLFRGVIILLLGGILLVVGAGYQVTAKPKPKNEPAAPGQVAPGNPG
jgi:hypothetical protein